MEKEQITEGNKLIAEFIGCTFADTEICIPAFSSEWYKAEDFDFVNDWNLIMRVVAKIEKHGYYSTIQSTIPKGFHRCWFNNELHGEVECEQGGSDVSKIEAVYMACIGFIKWYNQQSK